MRKHLFALLAVLGLGLAIFASFTSVFAPPAQSDVSLFDARKDRDAGVAEKKTSNEPMPTPPAEKYRLVRYPTKLGEFVAYLSAPTDDKKHPAIVWLKGGDQVLGDNWSGASSGGADEFDVFRKVGIVMMHPSLRGQNGNAGVYEYFYGEVEDVLAAVEYLAKQESVDPRRIYLAGHSTGGTLALLTAEYSDRFRAVFALAPVSDVRGYSAEVKPPLAKGDARGFELRSPIYWLKWIKTPVFVFEGDLAPGNIGDLRRLARARRNPLTHFYAVNKTDHVSSVAPVNQLIAAKILADTDEQVNIQFDEKDLSPL